MTLATEKKHGEVQPTGHHTITARASAAVPEWVERSGCISSATVDSDHNKHLSIFEALRCFKLLDVTLQPLVFSLKLCG